MNIRSGRTATRASSECPGDRGTSGSALAEFRVRIQSSTAARSSPTPVRRADKPVYRRGPHLPELLWLVAILKQPEKVTADTLTQSLLHHIAVVYRPRSHVTSAHGPVRPEARNIRISRPSFTGKPVFGLPVKIYLVRILEKKKKSHGDGHSFVVEKSS